MFCPNCGAINHGHKSEDEKIRYECRKCTVKFVRVPKGRRHDTIELFAAQGQEKLTAKLDEKRDKLLSELDTQIKVSNATTFIEF